MNEIYIYLGKALFGLLLFAVPAIIAVGVGYAAEHKDKIAIWIGKNFYGEDWTK